MDIESGEVAPNLVSKTNEELESFRNARSTESKRWRNQSIYRVPVSMKRDRSRVYEPQTVSLGPYHHGAERLKSMEEHKRRAFLNFLDRSEKPFHCYVEALAPVVEDLRGAYHDLDSKWKDDTEAFLKLMIVDGCFLLEIMRVATTEAETHRRMGYVHNDPVFSKHGKLCFLTCVLSDMLMLENQIPLLVLVTLLATEDDTLVISHDLSKQDQLSLLILKFFYQPNNDSMLFPELPEYCKCLHILALYHRSKLRCGEKPTPKKERCSGHYCLPCEKKAPMKIRSATELAHAGIRFEPSETGRLDDVSFEGGVLRLPAILVDDTLETEYLNMVAFEWCHAEAGTAVTSFLFLVDVIVHGARDVELLHSRGVVKKALSSDEACSEEGVAKLFSSMSRDITIDLDGNVADVLERADAYCRMPLPRFVVYSKRRYEHVTSWVSLSILGAITVFVLTGVPAVYTVLAYYHSKT